MLDNPTIPIPIPDGSTLVRKGRYLSIERISNHPIASLAERVPYHRYVMFEALGRPIASPCHWCGYVLPWLSRLSQSQVHVVNADHLDGDANNNEPENLVPSCGWCNVNRVWAENYPQFWSNWRLWMRDVPPALRPNLTDIARSQGFDPDEHRPKRERKPEPATAIDPKPLPSMRLHLADCDGFYGSNEYGETIDQIAERLQYHLAQQGKDVAIMPCRRMIGIMVLSGRLRKEDGKFYAK